MAVAKPQRRRIVPQLVQSPLERDDDIAGAPPVLPAAPQQLLQQEAQRGQSEWAREHLGPQRKVFLDLTDASNKEVDWRQILKERGVQKPSKAAKAEENGTGADPLLMRGRNARPDNPWTRMLAKVEQTYCVGALSDPEDDEEGRDDEASDSGSDMEDGGGEGGGGGKASDGGGEDGEGGGAAGGGEGGGGGAGSGAGAGKGGKEKRQGDYDYMDDFIDDEEFIQFVQHDKRKPKHNGFFISRGEIERTEEMLPGFEDLDKEAGKKGGGKRKAEEDAGGAEGAPAAKEARAAGEKKKRKQDGGDGGGAEAADKPAKKKKKVVAEASGAAAAAAATGPGAKLAKLSIAEQARLAGQQAAAGMAPAAAAAAGGPSGGGAGLLQPQRSGSHPPPSAKKRPPYEMPAEVAAGIARIRAVADQEPPPAPAPPKGEGEEGKKVRKVVPLAIKAAVEAFSPIYLQQQEAFGLPASKRIVDDLMSFLSPFASTINLKKYLAPSTKEKKAKEGVVVSEDQLKQIIAAKVKAVPAGSDDDFAAPPPPPQRDTSTSPPVPGTEAAAGGTQQAAAATAAAKPLWKALDAGVQQSVYQFLKGRLHGAKIGSAEGKVLQQEVYNWFPPNSIGINDVAAIFTARERREQRAQQAAASKAAALNAAAAHAGQAGAAPAAAGATAATAGAAAAGQAPSAQPQQQQQEGEQQQAASPLQAAAPHATQLTPAEAFAALAVAQASHKLASPPSKPSEGQGSGQLPPEVAESPQAAAAPAASHQQTPGRQQPAGRQQAGVASATAADGAAAQASAADATAGAAAPAPSQPPSQPPLVSKVSDEECVQAAAGFGADRQTMQDVLAESKKSKYSYAYTRALMLAGPEGLTTADVATRAVELGWEAWDVEKAKNQLYRPTKLPFIARLANGRHALRALPGVVHVEKPPAKGKQSGSAPSSAPAESPPEGKPVVAPAPAGPAAEADPGS